MFSRIILCDLHDWWFVRQIFSRNELCRLAPIKLQAYWDHGFRSIPMEPRSMRILSYRPMPILFMSRRRYLSLWFWKAGWVLREVEDHWELKLDAEEEEELQVEEVDRALPWTFNLYSTWFCFFFFVQYFNVFILQLNSTKYFALELQVLPLNIGYLVSINESSLEPLVIYTKLYHIIET